MSVLRTNLISMCNGKYIQICKRNYVGSVSSLYRRFLFRVDMARFTIILFFFFLNVEIIQQYITHIARVLKKCQSKQISFSALLAVDNTHSSNLTMSAEQSCETSARLREQRRSAQQKLSDLLVSFKPPQILLSVVCRCGCSEVRYTYMQTRSCDEGMTTVVQCKRCLDRWALPP